MIKAAVVGASGYVGAELVRLLLSHPGMEPAYLTAGQRAGRRLGEVSPQFWGLDLSLHNYSEEILLSRCEVAFMCLPHGKSMDVVAGLVDKVRLVVDLSADYRLPEDLYSKWYGEHRSPHLIADAVYGLPELTRGDLRGASLIASPGCYPTAALLGLLPLAEGGFVKGQVVVDAKSGVSGAGRSLSESNLFSQANEGVAAYAVGKHRHRPEIEHYLAGAAARPVPVSFTPHLIPMDRGILATIYAPLREGAPDDLASLYADRYAGEPFVEVLPAGQWPHTKGVRGSNRCHVGVVRDGDMAIAVAAIDNLVKGAAGQAVQAANIALGFKETAGLEAMGLFP